MPCALTEPDNYPDYLKRILKTIDVENDDDLKDCACSLRSPLTTEGCLAIGGDEKNGLFPFCTQESADSKYALWPLEKAMETYWRVRTWRFAANGVERTYDFPEDGQNRDYPFSTSITLTSVDGDYNPNTKQENLVCGNTFYNGNTGNIMRGNYAELGFDQLKKVGDLYDSGLGGYVLDGIEGWEYYIDSNRAPQVGTLSILGATVPINAYFDYDDQNEYESVVIALSATLTPISYWS